MHATSWLPSIEAGKSLEGEAEGARWAMKLGSGAQIHCLMHTQAVHSSTCNNAVYKAVGAGRTDMNCSSALAWWTIVFSFFELFLSQLKDFHSLWCAPYLLLLVSQVHLCITCHKWCCST